MNVAHVHAFYLFLAIEPKCIQTDNIVLSTKNTVKSKRASVKHVIFSTNLLTKTSLKIITKQRVAFDIQTIL